MRLFSISQLFRSRLQNQIFRFFLLAFLPFLVVGVWFLFASWQMIAKETRWELARLNELRVLTINGWFDRQVGIIDVLGHYRPLRFPSPANDTEWVSLVFIEDKQDIWFGPRQALSPRWLKRARQGNTHLMLSPDPNIFALTVPVPNGHIIAFYTRQYMNGLLQSVQVPLHGGIALYDSRDRLMLSTASEAIMKELEKTPRDQLTKLGKNYFVNEDKLAITNGYFVAITPLSVSLPASLQLVWMFFFLSIAVITISLFIARFFSYQITRPLEVLAEKARILGEGKLSERVLMEGAREITELAAAFNQMAERLSEQFTKTRDLNLALLQKSEELTLLNIQLSQGLEREAVINRIFNAAKTLLDLDAMLDVAVTEACVAIQATRGSVGFYEPSDEMLTMAHEYSSDPNSPSILGARVPLPDDHPYVRNLMKHHPQYVPDVRNPSPAMSGMSQALELSKSLGTGTLLTIPIIYQDDFIGVLNLAGAPGRQWRDEEIQLAQIVADQIAIGIINTRLFHDLKSSSEALHDLNLSLARKNQELFELDRMKSEFLSMVAHEFKTPLTTIKGFAQSLARQDVQFPRDRQLSYLNILVQQSNRLSRMIDNMLDISRMEMGKLQLSIEPVMILECAQKAKNELLLQSETHKIELDIQPPDLMVMADPDKLTQICLNLVTNAIKYSPSETTILIKANIAADRVHISVKDEGVGISRDDQVRLFSKFFQPSRQINQPSIKGTGLGLYITKGLIEAHGGDIWVESEFEKGTTFHISLPRVMLD